MSTGVVTAPSPELQEEWWDGGKFYNTEGQEEQQPSARANVSRRSAITVLEDALDLAVKAGLDWQQREAIDALIARAFQGTELSEIEIYALLDRWETETSRLGSVQAAKRSDAYQELRRMDSADVIRAVLQQLTNRPSPHLLTLLQEIAGAAPAATETTVAGASQAWLDWGKRQGLI